MTVLRDNRSLSIKPVARVTLARVVRSPLDERGCESFLSRSNLVSTRATFNFRFIERSDLQSGRDRSVHVRVCWKNVFAEITFLTGLLEIAINNRDVAFSDKECAVDFVNALIHLNIC